MRRERIRARLERGELPRDPAVAGFGAVTTVRFGISGGGTCSACEEPIAPGEAMAEYTFASGRVLSFHEECRRLWEAERRSPPAAP